MTACGAKSDDSYEDGGFEAPKTTTVTSMATPRGSSLLALLKHIIAGWGGDTIPFGRAGNAERRTICMVEGWGLRCRVEVLNEKSNSTSSGLRSRHSFRGTAWKPI